MTVITLARTKEIASFFNVEPFVFAALPSTYTLAPFWTDTFGVDEEPIASTISITQVIQDSLTNYNQVDSYADMVAEPQTFFFNSGTQVLYIHTGIGASPLMNRFDEGHSTGYSDKKLIYIDNIEYLPLLKLFPSIEQAQDIANYDKLSFANGEFVLDNLSGDLDGVIDETIFGNDLNQYYLDDSRDLSDYTAADLVAIAGFYVEDFEISQKELRLSAQDKRKAGDIKIPTALFTTTDYPNIEDKYAGKVIPLAYGSIKASKAIPTNGKLTSGSVTYRQALTLSTLGTVQVKINDAWITKSVTASDPATGAFTLASADARNGSSLYDCRVLDSVGIGVAHASDVIKDLNDRYLGIESTASNYNLAEWTEAEADLETIGLLVEKETELFEVIRLIQQGSNVGFRYEIDPAGKRSIRIDDWDRPESFTINNWDIYDIKDLPIKTKFSLLAARVRVEYARDYVSGETLSEIDDTNYAYVVDTYRQTPTREVESLLPTQALALARAADDADRYKDIIFVLSLTVIGNYFLGLRIFDTGTVVATQSFVDLDNLTISGLRDWLGVWKAQVLSIKPDSTGLKNVITLALISKKF